MHKIIKKRWDTYETDFIIENYKLLNIEQLARTLGRSYSSVGNKMYALNLNTPFRGSITKTSVAYLLSDNLESFYWIGFLLADGCFRKSNKNGNVGQITVLLAETDIDHLKKLAKHLNSKVYERKNTSFSKNPVKVSLTANDHHLVPRICDKFDINLRKTYNPPNMESYTDKFTKEQILATLIGLIDGDGCITSNGNGGFDLKIQLHSSWAGNLQYINRFVHDYFNTPLDAKVRTTKSGESSLSIGKQQLISFMKNFIINNSIPALDRKWSKVDNIDPKSITVQKPYRNTVTINGIEFKSQFAAAKHFRCSARHIGRLVKCNGNILLY